MFLYWMNIMSAILEQSCDIRKRIMRHWSRHDYFSGTGIDMFKAYDTTRIFVLECSRRWINTNEYNRLTLLIVITPSME